MSRSITDTITKRDRIPAVVVIPRQIPWWLIGSILIGAAIGIGTMLLWNRADEIACENAARAAQFTDRPSVFIKMDEILP